jgi:hypothetical protein
VNDQEQGASTVADLPKEPFRLTALNFSSNKVVNDEGLEKFKDCKNLTELNLWDTKVSDVGVAVFKDCKSLTHINLGSTKVSDDGLAFFKSCKQLQSLHLWARDHEGWLTMDATAVIA